MMDRRAPNPLDRFPPPCFQRAAVRAAACRPLGESIDLPRVDGRRGSEDGPLGRRSVSQGLTQTHKSQIYCADDTFEYLVLGKEGFFIRIIPWSEGNLICETFWLQSDMPDLRQRWCLTEYFLKRVFFIEILSVSTDNIAILILSRVENLAFLIHFLS